MKTVIAILVLLLAGCKSKESAVEENETGTIAVDSAKDFYKQSEVDYDYARFQGIYDHESKTHGFSAVLSVTENGNDLQVELSVSQSDGCKGNVDGAIFMMSHELNYYIGFYQLETCRLQFTFLLNEEKIDIKEINICTLHDASCSFEGSYLKRKS